MRRHHRSGLSIVESLLAVCVLGIAGTALAAAFAASTGARRRALVDSRIADAASVRIAQLAARPCAARDTSAVERGVGSVEWWSAHGDGAAWVLSDSVAVAGARAPGVLGGVIACA